jgi:uncharacterized protein
MFHDAIPDSLAIAAIFLAAGAVKGVLGMGLPTLAMGLLGLVLPVAGAAALLAIPSLVTNVWQAAVGPGLRAALQRHWAMQAGIALGVIAAALLFQAPPDAWGRRLLGACLLAYGVLGLWGLRLPPPPPRWERWVGAGMGAATGVVTGLTGVFVLPAVPYLQSLDLRKEELAQALGLCFTTSTLALVAVLGIQGHMHLGASLASLAMVVPALLGMWMGQSIRAGLSDTMFRRVFFIGLTVLGTWLLAR